MTTFSYTITFSDDEIDLLREALALKVKQAKAKFGRGDLRTAEWEALERKLMEARAQIASTNSLLWPREGT